ncbi:MAG: GNAT family N-acetyltransferase [Armatimonadetes bacterium]|nr:GNAT family N-acetyltransferase [Armatimonadota bacterium]
MIVLDQVILRPLEPSDVDRLYAFRNNPDVTSCLGGFSTGYSRQDLVDWVNAHRNRKDELLWAIAARDDSACLGHVGLYQIEHRVRKAEFGILIGDPGWQGKGIGRAVTRTVIDFGFQQLNLHKISLSVLESNSRAVKLYESLGFAREGLLVDDQYRDGQYISSILMALFKSDWKKGP